tara:strand:- start:365 stop:505 length:141 start_codon:yes stop_codon:yes gene_type:complete
VESFPWISKAHHSGEINEKLFRRQYPWAIATNNVEINPPKKMGGIL